MRFLALRDRGHGMSKFVTLAIGAAEIAAGVGFGLASGAFWNPLTQYLVIAGAGTVLGGLGTLLSKGPVQGFATTVRNPTAPWEVVYGQVRQGGVNVYENSWPAPGEGGGGNDVMIDLVIVLAAHASESVDVLLFDQQRVQINTTLKPAGAPANAGTSFDPKQQTVNIAEISRTNNVVTVKLNANIPYLIEGDNIKIQNVPGDLTLNGTFQVAQILSQVFGTPGSIIFTYLSGGPASDVLNAGQAVTLWAKYGASVYFEPLLGTQALGETFIGMQSGTPLDGDMGDFVSPEHTGGVDGTDQPNPWTQYCSLQGKTAVFLRMHFSSQYYPATIPQISFIMRGKNDILDPRNSPPTRGYSTNPALCIADFLSNTTYGYKAAYGSEIPAANLIAAANACDEPVPLAIGGSPPATEPLWACNGKFPLTMKRGEILSNLLTSCAGRLTTFGGQFIIWPAAWIGNSFAIGSAPGGGIVPLGDFNAIAAGPIRWKPSPSIRDLYNGVKGTYIAQPNKWMSGDFPPYCQDALHGYSGPSMYEGDVNLAYDGGDRRWLDIQLPFTTSSRQAQQTAKVELLRRRASGGGGRGSGTLILNMAGYQITPMDLLLATISQLSWTNKQLEVVDARLRMEESGDQGGVALLVEIDIQEVDSTINDWSTSEELSPQGYQQPAIPGVGAYQFFATEKVPGFNIPFPWRPGYVQPLKGDALYPTPVSGSETEGAGTFGLKVDYGIDNQGNSTVNVDVAGIAPPNDLSSPANSQPQIISALVGTGGSLSAGTYLVALSGVISGSPSENTPLSMPTKITVPAGATIDLIIDWPSAATSVEVYMAFGEPEAGFCYQSSLTGGSTSLTISAFDQATPGAPDGSLDHLAIAWKKVINGGPWAQQVQAVTPTTITIGGPGMTVNQWAGRALTLLGKLDSTQPLIVLNMPVAANTASLGTPPQFTLTIGPNTNGDQLPDLTTLLVPGDLVLMRYNATFTDTGFTDPLIANPYYPLGAAAGSPPTAVIEAGHVALVLTGPDAGDAQAIDSVGVDGFGNYTEILLANKWAITPNAGDIVIIVEAAFGPEVHSKALTAPSRGAVTGVLASPEVSNVQNQTWLFIARTQDATNNNGDDSYAPVREIFVFGSQGTRTITASTTMLPTDSTIDFDATAGDIVYSMLPQSQIPNQQYFFQKIDASANTVKILPAGTDTVNGEPFILLSKQYDCAFGKVPA